MLDTCATKFVSYSRVQLAHEERVPGITVAV